MVCGLAITDIRKRKYCSKKCVDKRRSELNRQRYKNNPEKKKQNARQWQKDNREKAMEAARKRYKNNPEKTKDRVVRWRKNNPEKAREAARKRYKNNPEKTKDRVMRWRKNNPEKARDISRRGNEKSRKKPMRIERQVSHIVHGQCYTNAVKTDPSRKAFNCGRWQRQKRLQAVL